MKTILSVILCFAMLASFGAGAASAENIFAPAAYWGWNRLADFMDIFSMGVGLTFENRIGGPIPPSFGAYAEATCLLNLGFVTHTGATLEWEGRGAGAITESRTLWGIGPYRGWRITQNAEFPNFYKDPVMSQAWAHRMDSDLRSEALSRINRWISGTTVGDWLEVTEVGSDPAKKPLHRDRYCRKAFFGVPRGWQTWEYIGAEVAICEPFITHMGITARAGFDLSEVFDFVLGFVFVDFKQDDRRVAE